MSTSNQSFGGTTEASTVAEAYKSQIYGRTILITGVAIGGIGGSTAIALAAHSPRLLILTGRSEARVQPVIDEIRSQHPNISCKFLQLDLSSQKSCRTAAAEVNSTYNVIDILINNAGVMNSPEYPRSVDGIELQFATNHIGHFLFTNLIMSKLVASTHAQSQSESNRKSTRIINVSSRAIVNGPVRFSDFNITQPISSLPADEHPSATSLAAYNLTLTPETTYLPPIGYAQSKTANVLFAVALNKRLPEGIEALALHPGVIGTELGRHMDPNVLQTLIKSFQARGLVPKTLGQGASTTLVAALDPALTGKANEALFLADCQVATWAPKWATDEEMADRLWKLSEELVGEKFKP